MDVCDLPREIEGILDACVRSQSVQRRVAVHSVSETEAGYQKRVVSQRPVRERLCEEAKNSHIALGVLLSDDIVNVPCRDIQDCGRCVVADKLPDASLKVAFRRLIVPSIAAGVREQNEHPLVPWLHHADNSHPAEAGMLSIRLHYPVKIARPALHQMGKVGFHEDVDCGSLTRPDAQR